MVVGFIEFTCIVRKCSRFWHILRRIYGEFACHSLGTRRYWQSLAFSASFACTRCRNLHLRMSKCVGVFVSAVILFCSLAMHLLMFPFSPILPLSSSLLTCLPLFPLSFGLRHHVSLFLLLSQQDFRAM